MKAQNKMKKSIKEVREFTRSRYSDFNQASKDPKAWANWAIANPIDSLKIWTEWVYANHNVSKMASQWIPDLTKCESFANALGYAIHLDLKYFRFEGRNYATTPRRNSGSIGSSTVNHQQQQDGVVNGEPYAPESDVSTAPVVNSFKQRIRDAIANADMEALEQAYKEAKASTKMTRGDKIDLRSAYMNGRAAIRNKKAAVRRQDKNWTKMAANSLDRADKRTAKADTALNSVGSIDEVKALIKKAIKEEVDRQKYLIK